MKLETFALIVSIITGATLIALGLVINPEWLATLALIGGGLFWGHALTEILNAPTE